MNTETVIVENIFSQNNSYWLFLKTIRGPRLLKLNDRFSYDDLLKNGIIPQTGLVRHAQLERDQNGNTVSIGKIVG